MTRDDFCSIASVIRVEDVSSRTVLILGGTGFVGSYLREHLRGEHRVVATSRSGAGADRAFRLADAASTSLFDEVAPDVVVNCTVSYASTLEECLAVNLHQTAALYLALRHRPLQLVQISSVSATADNKHQSDYGFTKAMGDELLAHVASHGELRATVLRFSQIFDAAGRSASSQPGLEAWGTAIRKGEPIRVFDREPRKRSYLPVESVVRAIAHAIRVPVHGTHDVIATESYTPRELVHLLAELGGYDPSRIERVDRSAAGYAIPACSPAFEGVLAQEPLRAAFARLLARDQGAPA